MSKVFYDHLSDFSELERLISEFAETRVEKEELWALVDEIIHHRVLGCCLDALPKENHEEFLEKVHSQPHEESVLEYLSEKIQKNAEELVRQELGSLAYELLKELSA